MKPIQEFNEFLKKTNWESSIVHEKKRFESWKLSFSLKTCVTEGKCVTQGMSKMCHSGYVYCKPFPQSALLFSRLFENLFGLLNKKLTILHLLSRVNMKFSQIVWMVSVRSLLQCLSWKLGSPGSSEESEKCLPKVVLVSIMLCLDSGTGLTRVILCQYNAGDFATLSWTAMVKVGFPTCKHSKYDTGQLTVMNKLIWGTHEHLVNPKSHNKFTRLFLVIYL